MNILGAVKDAAQGLAAGAMGAQFEPLLGQVVEKTLEWLGPRCGEVAVEKMCEMRPKLKKFDTAKDAAHDAAVAAVNGLKDDIMAFVKDAVEEPMEAWKKVGTMLLQCCRSAATDAVNELAKLLKCCCFGIGDVSTIIQSIYESCVEELKEKLKGKLTDFNVPQMLIDQLPWDFNENDDIGEPKSKKGMDPSGDAPAQPQTS